MTMQTPIFTEMLEPTLPEEDTLQRLWPELLRQYKGRYVALLNGQVVDTDADDETLAGRMYATHGDAPFLIAHIERTPTIYEV